MKAVNPDLKHFLQFKDFTREEFEYLFERTRWIKSQFKAYQQHWPLVDRTLVMIFEKASTRTRLSFEAGMQLHQVPIRRQAQVAFPWDLSGRPIHTRSVSPSGGAAVARGRRRSVGRAAPTTGYRGRQA